jgi:aryl-alcohol dehydrogenase-like predicted oxidoreductase
MMMKWYNQRMSELGCGLIAIGRQWGTTPEVPLEADALHFLSVAYEAGVRCFDTAPSYGTSEVILGKFLDSLTEKERVGVSVFTKFGEHWDSNQNSGYDDHSYDALRRSLDDSVTLLGRISILQLHRATLSHLRDEGVAKAFEYAKDVYNISNHGISMNTPALVEPVIADPRFAAVQLPLNEGRADFIPHLPPLYAAQKLVIANRPFAMGKALEEVKDYHVNAVKAYRFVLEKNPDGIILTGTSNPEHLRDNLAAFQEATQNV